MIALIIAIVSIISGFFKIPTGFELYTLDLRYRMRPPVATSNQLGFIDFDDESLALFGQWPWPRMRHVALINTLGFYGAGAVGFDVFFVEKENVRFFPEKIRNYVSTETTPNSEQFNRVVESSFKDYDRELAEAMKNSAIVYLAYFTQRDDKGGDVKDIKSVLLKTTKLKSQLTDAQKVSLNLLQETFLQSSPNLQNYLLKDISVIPPLSEFITASKGLGFAQPGLDKDSVVRNYAMFRYYDNMVAYPLILSMLSNVLDFKLEEMKITPGESLILRNAKSLTDSVRTDITIPLDKHSQMLLNWSGKFNDTFIHIPFKHISYYYAVIKAKEEARNWGGKPAAGEFNELETKIKAAINEESLVSAEDSSKISKKITNALFISKLIESGQDDNTIFDTLKSYNGQDSLKKDIREIRVAFEIEKALTQKPSITLEDFIKTRPDVKDASNLSEIFKNMQTFATRLTNIYPYYFPQTLPVNKNGVATPFSPTDLKDKIFMTGLTGTNTIDLNPSPFERSSPMVSYHLNALNTILTGNFLRHVPEAYTYAITIILAVITGLLGTALVLQAALPATLILAAGYVAVTYRLWVTKGYWFDWIVPVAAVVSTFFVVALLRYIEAFFERKRVRLIFSKMVSPSVLKVMENNPDKFSLTGERKAVTTFFSLIQGISDVIKGVSPDELPALLSIYLSPNSEIITSYDGYIDKYEGHVIMADFGVPLDDPLCALKCAFATVEQNLDIEAFRRFVFMRYGLPVSVSMGFNFGYVSAGNMGSERKFQYTVMGDSVNVSARFMAANFIYNAKNALTGEDTISEIKDYVHLRMLDKLLLKGKTRPTAIYEVLGWVTEAYKDFYKSKPVPQFVKYLWLRCSPEKFFCYREVWKERFEKTGFETANDIFGFFDTNMPLAADILVLEWEIEFLNIEIALKSIRHKMTKLFNRGFKPHPADDDVLSGIVAELSGIINIISDPAGINHADSNTLDELSLECDSLFTKTRMFQNRFNLKEHSGGEIVAECIADVESFMQQGVKGALEGRRQKLNMSLIEGQAKLRTIVEAFYNNLQLKPEAYHEMAAHLGSPSPEALKSKVHYEAGLQLYFQRKWNEATEMFMLSEAELAEDPPSRSFIKRIESFKEFPPPSSWQGEFIQTKK
ncbi:MAG: CHASE2 domain-containing protein [Nitrospirae bacterium YQR-1]